MPETSNVVKSTNFWELSWWNRVNRKPNCCQVINLSFPSSSFETYVCKIHISRNRTTHWFILHASAWERHFKLALFFLRNNIRANECYLIKMLCFVFFMEKAEIEHSASCWDQAEADN